MYRSLLLPVILVLGLVTPCAEAGKRTVAELIPELKKGDPEKLKGYLDKWVYGVPDRTTYMARQPGFAERLKADVRMAAGVNYGF